MIETTENISGYALD